MLVSTSTAQIFRLFGIDGGFKMIADAGFDAVDFGFDLDVPMWRIHRGEKDGIFFESEEKLLEHYAPYKAAADKYGVKIHQAHAPFPSYMQGDAETTAFALEAIKKCFPLLKMMDCHYLVVHPCFGNYDETLEDEDEWKLNIDFYSALIPDAKKYDVIVCLENMFTAHRRKIHEAICQDPNEAAAYVDELNDIAGEKRFGFCYDTGHALLVGKDQYRTLKQLGDRVDVLHVQDNDGKDDQHVAPFMGVLDWERFAKGLKAIGYKGTINLEVGNLCAWYPVELLADAYTLAAKCAKYIGSLVEKDEGKS